MGDAATAIREAGQLTDYLLRASKAVVSGPLHGIEKTRNVDENGKRNLPKCENNIKYIEEYDLP